MRQDAAWGNPFIARQHTVVIRKEHDVDRRPHTKRMHR